MYILFVVVIVIAFISGCGPNRPTLKSSLGETTVEQSNPVVTGDDLLALEKKIKDQRLHAIKYHRDTWPHGCECK